MICFSDQDNKTVPRINTKFDDADLEHLLHLLLNIFTLVMAGVVLSLFDGFSVASINIVFNKGSTGEVSNTGSEDTRVFLKNVVQLLTLICPAQLEVFHLPWRLTMAWVVVVVLRRASSIIVRP